MPSAKLFKDVEVTTKHDFWLGPSLELTRGEYYWSKLTFMLQLGDRWGRTRTKCVRYSFYLKYT